MKTTFLKSSALIALIAFGGLSCSKDDAAAPTVSEEDAADVVGSYVASDLTASTSDATSISAKTGDQAGGRLMTNGRTETSSCGVAYDSTVTRSGVIGSAITYAYNLTYGYTLTCNGKIPSSLDFGLSSTGTYSGPRVSSSGTGEGTWAITGFTASSFSLNGTYTKTETVTQKTGAQKVFASTLTLTITDVTLDKSTQKLTGGTISYTMTGSITGGTSFTFSGSITLLGNESATITVGSTSYTVNLATGTVTKS